MEQEINLLTCDQEIEDACTDILKAVACAAVLGDALNGNTEKAEQARTLYKLMFEYDHAIRANLYECWWGCGWFGFEHELKPDESGEVNCPNCDGYLGLMQ